MGPCESRGCGLRTTWCLLDIGERGLEGRVLYPTRDEIVAAISRRRDELQPFFRVPTPPWMY
jgi:D-aspartate ligase